MPDRLSELTKRAKAAVDKPAALGPDIDLAQFAPTGSGKTELSDEDAANLLLAGVDLSGKGRGGSFVMSDDHVVSCSANIEGVELIPVTEALERYEWARELYWGLVPVDMDKYTAAAHLDLHDGYFIRALPGAKVTMPLQTCLYITTEGLRQHVHNIMIAEEGSELHIISGCATAPHLTRGLHIGISEFYVRKGATLSFTMIHKWAPDVAVRPRSAARVEEGGLFLSNYITLNPVKDLQSYPTVHLEGPEAVARLYSIIRGHPGNQIDLGGRVYLRHPGCRAEIVSRAITGGARITARGHLVGTSPGIKAHLECRGLILGGGALLAIPELEGHTEGVEMSHEAAVGKIAQEEIFYLMSRGLSEEEATSTIVRGFLTIDIPELPAPLKAEMDRAIEATDTHAM